MSSIEDRNPVMKTAAYQAYRLIEFVSSMTIALLVGSAFFAILILAHPEAVKVDFAVSIIITFVLAMVFAITDNYRRYKDWRIS